MSTVMNPTLAEAERRARNRVNAWSAGAAAVGWIPGSMVVLAGADLKLCQEVAECFGVEHYSAESVTAAISASIVGKVVATEALSFIPVVGWAIKAGVAGSVTKATGEAIIAYFKSRSPYR